MTLSIRTRYQLRLCWISILIYLYVEYHTLDIISHYTECRYAECHYAECHYAECHYAECHYAVCHYMNIIVLNVIMLRVIMLNIITLNVIMQNITLLSVVMLNVYMLNLLCWVLCCWILSCGMPLWWTFMAFPVANTTASYFWLFLFSVEIGGTPIFGDGCVCPGDDFDGWLRDFGCESTSQDVYRQIDDDLAPMLLKLFTAVMYRFSY
jgi:hypothetical protein